MQFEKQKYGSEGSSSRVVNWSVVRMNQVTILS